MDKRNPNLALDYSWSRHLALALVRDTDLADELAQEAWLVAARRSGGVGPHFRPWLGGVLRNLRRMHFRTQTRRKRREQAAFSLATELGGVEALEDDSLHKKLLAELLADLEEPYRQTVYDRFYKGLSSADIARRDGLPEGTVRRRLKEGLDRLRAGLEERTGDARSFCLALLGPVASAPNPAPIAKLATVRFALGVIACSSLLGTVAAISSLRAIGKSEGSSPAVLPQVMSADALGMVQAALPSEPPSPEPAPVRAPKGRRHAIERLEAFPPNAVERAESPRPSEKRVKLAPSAPEPVSPEGEVSKETAKPIMPERKRITIAVAKGDHFELTALGVSKSVRVTSGDLLGPGFFVLGRFADGLRGRVGGHPVELNLSGNRVSGLDNGNQVNFTVEPTGEILHIKGAVHGRPTDFRIGAESIAGRVAGCRLELWAKGDEYEGSLCEGYLRLRIPTAALRLSLAEFAATLAELFAHPNLGGRDKCEREEGGTVEPGADAHRVKCCLAVCART
jgi:RNA polymerase sigma-70 factor (ECF subfamily)